MDDEAISELSDLLENTTKDDAASKKAIETLHPNDEEKKDRLTVLTQQEVGAHSAVEWIVKALQQKDWTSGLLVMGLSDKIKALKVSQEGRGRGEVSTIFKPEIVSELLGQGWFPPSSALSPQQGVRRGGFFGRLFGR